jgi:hypothetical protein
MGMLLAITANIVRVILVLFRFPHHPLYSATKTHCYSEIDLHLSEVILLY